MLRLSGMVIIFIRSYQRYNRYIEIFQILWASNMTFQGIKIAIDRIFIYNAIILLQCGNHIWLLIRPLFSENFLS